MDFSSWINLIRVRCTSLCAYICFQRWQHWTQTIDIWLHSAKTDEVSHRMTSRLWPIAVIEWRLIAEGRLVWSWFVALCEWNPTPFTLKDVVWYFVHHLSITYLSTGDKLKLLQFVAFCFQSFLNSNLIGVLMVYCSSPLKNISVEITRVCFA